MFFEKTHGLIIK